MILARATTTTAEGAPPERQMSLGEKVYSMLLTRITSGVYPPETRLPSEHDLASQFEVSRPVIREALERLRNEGMINSRQGSGSYVLGEIDAALRLNYPPVETIADIQRCYEFRITFEPDAAGLAALRRNDQALARIGDALGLLTDATQRQTHREDADFAFHHAIAEASNNQFYSATMRALREHIGIGMKFHGLTLLRGAKSGLAPVLDEHRAIHAAIERQDDSLAHDLMAAHLRGSRDRMFEGRLLDLSLT